MRVNELKFQHGGILNLVEEAAVSGLNALYKLLNVTPVPPRCIHDGISMIRVEATGWVDQHEELWGLLVPGQGSAKTVQGEAIRITGRISQDEGAHWDAEYRKMLSALLMLALIEN
jgi:hypothetical protein